MIGSRGGLASLTNRSAHRSPLSGILTSPNLPAYVASKHAIEGLTDSLATQLAPLGVQVSVVKPGNYKSDVVKNMLARLSPDLRAKAMPGPRESQLPEPTDVALAVEQALFEPRPKRRPNRANYARRTYARSA